MLDFFVSLLGFLVLLPLQAGVAFEFLVILEQLALLALVVSVVSVGNQQHCRHLDLLALACQFHEAFCIGQSY